MLRHILKSSTTRVGHRVTNSRWSMQARYVSIPGEIKQINASIDDVPSCVKFYKDAFWFEVLAGDRTSKALLGTRKGFRIALQEKWDVSASDSNQIASEDTLEDNTHASDQMSFPMLLVSTSNVKTTVRNAKRRNGVQVIPPTEVQKNVIATMLRDPANISLCAIHHFSRNPVLAVGLQVTNLDQSKDLFCQALGMSVAEQLTETEIARYLAPLDLMNNKHSRHIILCHEDAPMSSKLVLYQDIASENNTSHTSNISIHENAILTIDVANIWTALETMQKMGITTEPSVLSAEDTDFLCEHPDGYVIRVRELAPVMYQ